MGHSLSFPFSVSLSLSLPLSISLSPTITLISLSLYPSRLALALSVSFLFSLPLSLSSRSFSLSLPISRSLPYTVVNSNKEPEEYKQIVELMKAIEVSNTDSDQDPKAADADNVSAAHQSSEMLVNAFLGSALRAAEVTIATISHPQEERAEEEEEEEAIDWKPSLKQREEQFFHDMYNNPALQSGVNHPLSHLVDMTAAINSTLGGFVRCWSPLLLLLLLLLTHDHSLLLCCRAVGGCTASFHPQEDRPWAQ